MTRFERLDLSTYALPAELTSRLLSPALVVWLDHVRENLRRVIARFGGTPERWRPHVKTVKIPAVFSELARAGVRGFKCATTREAAELAATLAADGIVGADVLVAYPLLGPNLERLAALAEQRPETRFSVLCEEPAAAGRVPAALDLFVDVNPGMHRTGVPLEERERILAVARCAGTRLRGVHCYEGHLRAADLDERRRSIFECYDRLVGLVRFLAEAHVRVAEVVTAGTPSLVDALSYSGFAELDGTIHRLSPGTVVYHDLLTEQENPQLDLVPAALVFSRVVSRPRADVVTCDAGSKALAAEAGDPCAFVLGHPELGPERPSEEHLPLRVRWGAPPATGSGLLLVPRHVCPTVNLAEAAILVERDGRCEVVQVAARAHDLVLPA